jgi:Uma2 family endonuclease
MSAVLFPSGTSLPRSRLGEPPWAVALFFPRQGEWTESDYLQLGDKNWMVELANGCLEVLPMPTLFYQLMVKYLVGALEAFLKGGVGGLVLFAPVPVRLWPEQFREPDVFYLRPERIPADLKTPPNGADLAMEVVSDTAESRKHDLETKRVEYARAGIAEYWIVDPALRSITVLVLDGDHYREHGVFGPGTQATSVLLSGFAVAVDAVFAEATHAPGLRQ